MPFKSIRKAHSRDKTAYGDGPVRRNTREMRRRLRLAARLISPPTIVMDDLGGRLTSALQRGRGHVRRTMADRDDTNGRVFVRYAERRPDRGSIATREA